MDNPIKVMAKKKGASLKEVAIVAGLKCQQIYHIGQGRAFPVDATICSLAKALNVTPIELKIKLQEYHRQLREELSAKMREVSNDGKI
jgi:transcriptional regulator with XRE-family HTH domain